MYRKPAFGPPWKGFQDHQPAMTLDPSTFKSVSNYIVNKQRIQPFPLLTTFANLPTLPNGDQLLGARSFLDAQTQFHTLLLGPNTAYFLTAIAPFFTQLTPLVNTQTWVRALQPYSFEVFTNKLFFTNGSSPLQFVQGYRFWETAGDVPGSCFYLGKLASHLLMINTTEFQFNFPARVRWSMVGNGSVWITNPSTQLLEPTAGFVDIADVEDQLTGWATIGTVGLAFRNNGITIVTDTGSLPPFRFENFSIGPTGVGNAFPGSLAVYGSDCVFGALDDVYWMSGFSAPNPIGGVAKKAIINDLVSSSSQIVSQMFGTLGPGVDYKSYWLAIPQSNDTKTSLWIYHFDSQSWMNEQLPYGALRSMGNLILT